MGSDGNLGVVALDDLGEPALDPEGGEGERAVRHGSYPGERRRRESTAVVAAVGRRG